MSQIAKMKIILIIVLLATFGSSCSHSIVSKESTILSINVIDRIPDDVEGCACWLSKNDSLFESQKHIFACSNDSIAFMMINNELTKISNQSPSSKPFNFEGNTWNGDYSNEKYQVRIFSIFEDSTRYDSWMFKGIISVTDENGNETSMNYVGACGC